MFASPNDVVAAAVLWWLLCYLVPEPHHPLALPALRANQAEQRHQEDGEAGKSVTERLSREARARQRARAMRHQAWEAKVRWVLRCAANTLLYPSLRCALRGLLCVGNAHQLAADYKFKPTINPKSEALVSEKPEYQRDFVTRQELLRQEQERNFDAVIERVELETNQCTFKPSIGNANEVLVHTRPSRLGENEADVVERLSTRDRQRIQQLRRDMENEYYAQFNFKPKLNERSKRIGVPVSVEEQTERRREARERAAAEVMAKRMAECTFQPKTTKTPEVRCPRATCIGWLPALAGFCSSHLPRLCRVRTSLFGGTVKRRAVVRSGSSWISATTRSRSRRRSRRMSG